MTNEAADAFEELWPTLAIPGEFDAMDACDQARWRGVIEDAFEAGRVTEREACAKVCEQHAAFQMSANYCADRIRERSNVGAERRP